MDIIIETPKNSTVKYKYDHEHRMFRLHKVLPTGLAFPFDFGFIPNTLAEDDDPIDALVVSEFPGFPGCVMDCRIVGCIQVEQRKLQRLIRNDRYLAIPEQSRVYENVISIEDIPVSIITEIESFFTTYMKEEGREFQLLGNLNASQAEALLDLE